MNIYIYITNEGKFFYREKAEGKKVYKFKVLPDAKNLDEAELSAKNEIVEFIIFIFQ